MLSRRRYHSDHAHEPTVSRPSVSIVLPCFNEAASLPAIAEAVLPWLRSLNTELIFVDNGSSDETWEVIQAQLARSRCFRAHRILANIGYGHGIMAGLRLATGDFVGWTHADLQTAPDDIRRAISLLDAHGWDRSLYVKGVRPERPPLDIAFTFGMGILSSLLLGARLVEINAQPNVFHRTLLDRLANPPLDYCFDLYVYGIALHEHLTFLRFPVTFGPRKHGSSHWNRGLGSRLRLSLRFAKYAWGLGRLRCLDKRDT